MTTPWSTNAVEITQNMGISGIKRIEEFIFFNNKNSFDQMTNELYQKLDQNIFTVNIEPEDSIEITNLGNSSLRYELFSNVGNGNSSNFYGEYYSSPGTNGSPDFGDFIFSREDEFIDFNWGNNSPDQLLQSDDFQIRWSGDIYAEDNGLYFFRAYTDDGVRLYIDDVLVIFLLIPISVILFLWDFKYLSLLFEVCSTTLPW